LVLLPFLGAAILSAQEIAPTTAFFNPPQSPRVALARAATLEDTLQGGLSGRWWAMPRVVQRLGLTADQQKRMDEVFQQSRLKLIDLTAALDKEEAILEPLVEADQPDAPKIRTQIDRIAQARAELEKANANMLLGIRLILTPEQWKDRPGPGRGLRGGAIFNGSPVPALDPKRK
jgi:Spy/CpxP family protein refolding chaperone